MNQVRGLLSIIHTRLPAYYLLLSCSALSFSPLTVLGDQSISRLEEQIQTMEEQLQILQEELTRIKADTGKEPAPHTKSLNKLPIEEKSQLLQPSAHNMLFFRGGYISLNNDRSNQVFTDFFESGDIQNNADSGWYVGAGFDYFLTDSIWGLVPRTAVFAELGIEYKKPRYKR